MTHWILHVTYETGEEFKVTFDKYEPTEAQRTQFIEWFTALQGVSTITRWIAPSV